MRLQILSDLHLEFSSSDAVPTTDSDIVILAGDIHVGSNAIAWIQKCFPVQPVVYILGNHEFYHHSIPELTEKLKREAKGSRIHILENDSVQIGGFTFLGCTLWSDFQICRDPLNAMRLAHERLSDFNVIALKSENRMFHPLRAVEFFEKSAAWLKCQLDVCEPSKTVVVTHHAPSEKSIPPVHAGSLLNGAFVSNLEDVIAESSVPLWIHGHTHHNIDYRISRTRVLSNQRGYPSDPVDGFNPALVVEL